MANSCTKTSSNEDSIHMESKAHNGFREKSRTDEDDLLDISKIVPE